MASKSYRSITLLLNRNVEGLGIVGDVVKVKPGFARNYLLPLGIAEPPTDERIAALKEAREVAQAELERVRAERAGIIEALVDKSIELIRSCNDRGILYGSVTQQDISDALRGIGYAVDERAVRLAQPIRRLGDFPVAVQFDKDLRSEIVIKVLPDRSLAEEIEEMEFDNEGNLIEKPKRKARVENADESAAEEDADTDSEDNASAEGSTSEPVEAASNNG